MCKAPNFQHLKTNRTARTCRALNEIIMQTTKPFNFIDKNQGARMHKKIKIKNSTTMQQTNLDTDFELNKI